MLYIGKEDQSRLDDEARRLQALEKRRREEEKRLREEAERRRLEEERRRREEEARRRRADEERRRLAELEARRRRERENKARSWNALWRGVMIPGWGQLYRGSMLRAGFFGGGRFVAIAWKTAIDGEGWWSIDGSPGSWTLVNVPTQKGTVTGLMTGVGYGPGGFCDVILSADGASWSIINSGVMPSPMWAITFALLPAL